MLTKTLVIAGLTFFAAFSLGAKCVKYVWTSPGDRALYGEIQWHDTDLGPTGYAFAPAYPVRERAIDSACAGSATRPALVQRGGLGCTRYVLDVDTPSGTVTISDVKALLKLLGPIDTEAEASSFAKATIGGYAQYDGATAAGNGNFLVRMTSLLDNCTVTMGRYAIAYEITRDGHTRVVAEEARRANPDGAAICYD